VVGEDRRIESTPGLRVRLQEVRDDAVQVSSLGRRDAVQDRLSHHGIPEPAQPFAAGFDEDVGVHPLLDQLDQAMRLVLGEHRTQCLETDLLPKEGGESEQLFARPGERIHAPEDDRAEVAHEAVSTVAIRAAARVLEQLDHVAGVPTGNRVDLIGDVPCPLGLFDASSDIGRRLLGGPCPQGHGPKPSATHERARCSQPHLLVASRPEEPDRE
jgi:hypothetical protein